VKTILLAGLISLVVALVGTRLLIGYLKKHHYGPGVRDDLQNLHAAKGGTPSMGGLAIILAIILAYVGTHLATQRPPTASALLVLGLMIGTGLIGFLDDWSKVRHEHSGGLKPWVKLVGQGIVGVAFGVLALKFPDAVGITPASRAISFTRDINGAVVHLAVVAAVIWMTLLIAGFSNAVNITDGLDGLASGSVAIVFFAYALINIWQSSQWCEQAVLSPTPVTAMCYPVRDPYDLGMTSIAIAAACFGFLWWNAKPARIFLGDTGSLALGAAMAGMAICTRTELLLFILGALFVVETGSVALQVCYFKATHGKRIFKMSPLHHHFELLGWEEQTVVVRFWIMSGIAVCLGFGLFYAEWVVRSR